MDLGVKVHQHFERPQRRPRLPLGTALQDLPAMTSVVCSFSSQAGYEIL